MTRERAPASAHASAHASVHESAHKSWLSLCCNPIQRLPLECSRECSRGCPRKCTQSGLVVCHLVCFHLLCSFPKKNTGLQPIRSQKAVHVHKASPAFYAFSLEIKLLGHGSLTALCNVCSKQLVSCGPADGKHLVELWAMSAGESGPTSLPSCCLFFSC